MRGLSVSAYLGELWVRRHPSVRPFIVEVEKALPAEILLDSVILISPLHRFFLPLWFLGADFQIGRISLAGGNSVVDRR